MRPISKKRQQRDKSYSDRRVDVYERAGGRCESPEHVEGCSGRCEAVHHIGGRLGPDPHRLENLAGLSRACHDAAHAYPQWALWVGLKVSRNGVQP